MLKIIIEKISILSNALNEQHPDVAEYFHTL